MNSPLTPTSSQSTILKSLRHLERGLLPRLLSIEHDTRQVLTIYTLLHPLPAPSRPTPSSLPLFANSRAGCWYVPPNVRSSTTHICAFKSADGHYGQWASSLRRPNIHVLRAALTHGAAVVVDATRAGKTWPDALTKTLPIWCAVISIVSGLVICTCTPTNDITTCLKCCPLYLHPSVPPSERSSILKKLPQWCEEWKRGAPDLPRLVRALTNAAGTPLRPVRALWVAPGRVMWDRGLPLSQLDFVPIVCVSASKVIQHSMRAYIDPLPATSVCGIQFYERQAGFSYVQGAGDDEEAWALGLTPRAFWEHRKHLLDIDPQESQSGCEDRLREKITTLMENIGEQGSSIYARPVEADGAMGREFATVVWEARIRLVRAPLKNLKDFVHGAAKRFGCVIVMGTDDPDAPPPVVISRRASSNFGSEYSAQTQESFVTAADTIGLNGRSERLRRQEAELQRRAMDYDSGLSRISLVDDNDDDEDDNEEERKKGKGNIAWMPLTDHKGKIDYKYGFGRALGPCLSLLRRCCIDLSKEALICCTGKDGDWGAGVAIAWLAWHCIPADVSVASCSSSQTVESIFDESVPGYAVNMERREGVGQIEKDRVHAVMLHFMSTFPHFQLSRATLKQLNRFFSSPEPSSTVFEL